MDTKPYYTSDREHWHHPKMDSQKAYWQKQRTKGFSSGINLQGEKETERKGKYKMKLFSDGGWW